MAVTEQSVMGVMRAARPTFRNAHDKIAFAIHSSFLASGFILLATGPSAVSDDAFNSSTDEVGIEHWNELDHHYGFVYSNSENGSAKILVKCVAVNDTLMVDALREGDSDPAHLEFNVKDYVADEGGNSYTSMFKDFKKLVADIDEKILSLYNDSREAGSSRQEERDSMQVYTYPFPHLIGVPRTGSSHQGDPLEVYTYPFPHLVGESGTGSSHEGGPWEVYTYPFPHLLGESGVGSSRQGEIPPSEVYTYPFQHLVADSATVTFNSYVPAFPVPPVPPVPAVLPVPPVPSVPFYGGDDLHPGGGAGVYPRRGEIGGGSMLVGPNDPRFFGGGGIGAGRVPGHIPGSVPPGARFDPFGPPGVPGFEPGRFMRRGPRSGSGQGNHPDLEPFGNDPDHFI